MLTYSLGTQREEREDVAIAQLHQGAIDVRSGLDWTGLDWMGWDGGRAKRWRREGGLGRIQSAAAGGGGSPGVSASSKNKPQSQNANLKSNQTQQFTSDYVDLERWYADPKRRERSYAVKISRWLRAQRAGVCG